MKQGNKIVTLITSKKFMLGLGVVGLFLLTTGISWAIFTLISGKKPDLSILPGQLGSARSKINLDLPKTEACPVNGGMFTKVEKNIWEERRPITAVIENHVDSRPPSGLSRADVIYEAVAEGGITRFLTVFYCGAAASDVRIGPIRSVRVYFVNWASEYGGFPLFVHSGGANTICNNCPGGVKPRGSVAREVDAFRLLADIGWRGSAANAMDAGTNVGFPIVWRDYERIPGAATEHTFMGSTDKIYDEGAKRGFGYKDESGAKWIDDFTAWKFADGKADNPSVTNIAFEFWSNKSDYDVEWKFDAANNRYLRFDGGREHVDMDTKEQLAAKNVVIQFVDERGPVDKEGHMFYTTEGTGEALVFQNGTVIEGTWKKKTRTDRTKFYDSKGAEIAFVRGVIWIEAVPDGNTISY